METQKIIKKMKQEDKQLLLKALHGYLPHRLKSTVVNFIDSNGSQYYTDCEILGIRKNQLVEFIRLQDNKEIGRSEWYDISWFKPYLRPMSSMTEEEILHMQTLVQNKNLELYSKIEECGATGTPDWKLYEISYIRTAEEIDYLNSRHLDWRGLINIDLAIKAPEDMYDK